MTWRLTKLHRYRMTDNFIQLSRCFNRIFPTLLHNMLCNILSKFIFPIVADHTVKFRLTVFVDNVSRRHFLSLIHSHIKRRIHPIRKSAFGGIKLVWWNSQIDHNTIYFVNTYILELRLHITIIAPNYRNLLPEAFQAFSRCFNCIGILIYSYKSPLTAKPSAHFIGMSASAKRSVYINPIRFDVQPVYCFVQ